MSKTELSSSDTGLNDVPEFTLLNISVHNWTFSAFVESLKKGVVVTPNVDHFVKLQKDEAFYRCYVQSEHIVCDSRVVQLVSKLLYGKKAIREQIAGSDLFPAYVMHHADGHAARRIFLLGGTEQSVHTAQKNLNDKAGCNIIVDVYSPPFGFEQSEAECKKIIDRIVSSDANVLAVGVGTPKQEFWIHKHRERLTNIDLIFAIGATINFQAGAVKRAPRWMVNAGMEWLYRIFQEPKRMLKRYLVDDLPFFWLIFKQKLGLYKNPWS